MALLAGLGTDVLHRNRMAPSLTCCRLPVGCASIDSQYERRRCSEREEANGDDSLLEIHGDRRTVPDPFEPKAVNVKQVLRHDSDDKRMTLSVLPAERAQ